MTEKLRRPKTRIAIDIDLEYIRNLFLSLAGEHLVEPKDIFTDDFFLRHTKYRSLKEMLASAGLTENDDVDTRSFRSFIYRNTKFFDYADMCKIAASEYFVMKLGIVMPNRQLTATSEKVVDRGGPMI